MPLKKDPEDDNAGENSKKKPAGILARLLSCFFKVRRRDKYYTLSGEEKSSLIQYLKKTKELNEKLLARLDDLGVGTPLETDNHTNENKEQSHENNESLNTHGNTLVEAIEKGLITPLPCPVVPEKEGIKKPPVLHYYEGEVTSSAKANRFKEQKKDLRHLHYGSTARPGNPSQNRKETRRPRVVNTGNTIKTTRKRQVGSIY